MWNKVLNLKTILSLLFVRLAIALIVFGVEALTASSSASINYNSKLDDYTVLIGATAITLLMMFIPTIISKAFKLNIPPLFSFVFIVFCYCGIFLGATKSIFYIIPFWDKILHAISGILLGILGLSLIPLLNKDNDESLSPIFAAAFVFCFAVTLGTFWEVFEYIMDSLLDLNLQRYAFQDGELISGQAVLVDTIVDLIADAVGALAMAVFAYISLKQKKNWHTKYAITQKSPSTATTRLPSEEAAV